MRALRIATLHSKNDHGFLARCQAPLTWLRKQGAIELVAPLQAWTADVVLLYDQWQPGALAVAQSLRHHGIRVVASLDEDVFAVPVEHGSFQVYRDPLFQASARQLLEAADLVLTPTGQLASKISRITSSIRVTPDGIDLANWRKEYCGAACDSVRIVGLAATRAQGGHLEILRPVLA